MNKTNFDRMTPGAKNLSIRTLRASQIPLNSHSRKILLLAFIAHIGQAQGLDPATAAGLGGMLAGTAIRVGEWWGKLWVAQQASKEAKTWLPYAVALASIFVLVTILNFVSNYGERRSREANRRHALNMAARAQANAAEERAHQRELAQIQFQQFQLMMNAWTSGRDPSVGPMLYNAEKLALPVLAAAPRPALLLRNANANAASVVSPRSLPLRSLRD